MPLPLEELDGLIVLLKDRNSKYGEEKGTGSAG
jgi:hypothetical protein